MKYYLYDRENDDWTTYDDWWAIVGFFYGDWEYYHHKSGDINNIAHNDNDGYFVVDSHHVWNAELEMYIHTEQRYWKPLRFTVYDEDNIIINKAEIVTALKIYDPNKTANVYRKRKHYNFRSNKSWMGFRRNVHRNKRYVAEIMEHNYLFPCSGRARNSYWFVMTRDDDIPSRSTHRNWKCHSKKKHQWE